MRLTELPELYDFLRPYQRRGVRRLQELNGRALLADEPGLGKTIQTIAWLALNPELRPAVIICPAIAKHHWRNQTNLFLKDEEISVISSLNTSNFNDNASIYIVNYDILSNAKIEAHANFSLCGYPDEKPIRVKKPQEFEIPFTGWIDFLVDIEPQVLILDEVHRAKNSKAQRTQAIKKLVNTKHLICISGTPVDNRPGEFFNSINWIRKDLFPNKRSFLMRYCGPKINRFAKMGISFDGASNTEELHKVLTESIMIRRLKSEVYEQLPPKTRTIIPLEIDNRREYDVADKNFMTYLKSQGKTDSAGGHLAKLETLKQVAVKGKMKQAITWIEKFLESRQKLVVFCEHKKVVVQLMDKFGKIAISVTGDTSHKNREDAERLFQTDKNVKLFVGNIQAAGVSLTLTAASNVVILELPDTPSELTQAEDRVYGRLDNPHGANIWFLIGMDTIEEKIAKMLDKKAEIASKIIDGKTIESKSLLKELIDSLKSLAKEGEF